LSNASDTTVDVADLAAGAVTAIPATARRAAENAAIPRT
jgi:hypothetical protein